LHTTVIDNNGETFEVQIRTYQMHQTAEYGIAAHWKYKTGQTKTTSFDENLTWLRQLMEWQKDLNDPNDFMDTLKVDFFADEVFVFSPKGDVINLPEGSTPIDFAYRIHTQVGNTCVGAKVNGRIVPLSYKLSSGNIVDIITNSNSGPSLDWLNIVKSNQAKKKISQYFKIKDRDKNIEKGKEILEKEAKRLNYNVNEFLKDEWIDEVRAKLNVSTIDDLYAALGFGTVKLSQVTAKLIDIYNRFNKKPIKNIVKSKRKVQKSGIDVKGVDGVKVRIAKCCTPVPGDDIIGYITIGRGISVHRADCPNVNNNVEESRIVQVSWQKDEANSYEAAIEVRALDKPNVIGDVANRINEAKLNMTSLNARSTRDGDAIVDVILEITNIDELEGIIDKLKRVKNVFDVYRMKA
ncbi:RelA/SpoT family protein, partial [Peptoniphilus sp. oral taxon 836 str. F0141]